MSFTPSYSESNFLLERLIEHRRLCHTSTDSPRVNVGERYPLDIAATRYGEESGARAPVSSLDTLPLESPYNRYDEVNAQMDDDGRDYGGVKPAHQCSVVPPRENLDEGCKQKMEDRLAEIALEFDLSNYQIRNIERRRDGFKEAIIDTMNVAKQAAWHDLESAARLLIMGERCVDPIRW